MFKKYSNVFLITAPFAHSGSFDTADLENMREQYQYVIDMLADRPDTLVAFEGYWASQIGHGTSTEEVTALAKYAQKKLGTRFVDIGMVNFNFHDQLSPRLDRSKEIRIEGCGEHLRACSEENLKIVQQHLEKKGFRAVYHSNWLVGSTTGRREEFRSIQRRPFYRKDQFREVKRQNRKK